MTGFSPRINKAVTFAARAHRAQVRKGTDIPYIAHPVQVAMALMRHGFDEDLIIAGLLHDTVEDCDVSSEQVRAVFGADVATLVANVTEAKAVPGQPRPWRARKEAALAHLAHADDRTSALKAADALHNASCLIDDLVTHGDAVVWTRFSVGAIDSLWYYAEISRLCSLRLGEHPLAVELRATVEELARLVPA